MPLMINGLRFVPFFHFMGCEKIILFIADYIYLHE